MQEKSPDARDVGQQFAPIYSPGLQALLQSLLATLANLDFEYEQTRKKANFTTDINLRIRVLERLKESHRVRREPYIRELAILQERIQSVRA